MGWFGDMFIIILVGLINIIAAIVLGTYWLKHERYPWEKSSKEVTMNVNIQEKGDRKL